MKKLVILVSFFVLGVGVVYIAFPLKSILNKDHIIREKIIKGEISSYKSPELNLKKKAEFESINTETVIVPTAIPIAALSYVGQGEETTIEERFIINAINRYRQDNGLSPVRMNSDTCSFAIIRAKEIEDNFSHDGFNSRVVDGTLPYSTYSKVTENISEGYGYQDVVNAWIESPSHAENLRADTPYVCVKASNVYFAFEGWRP